ncbi:MAG: hypothetical protein AB7O59_12820 [Pirellulales bacterium]
MNQQIKRRKKFIDFDVQGTLLVRVVFYWALCILVTGLVLVAWQVLVSENGPFLSHFRLDLLWIDYRAALIASLFTLPLILFDTLHISHRFAGPNSRLRRSMRELAAGQKVEPVRLRPNDFWQGMAAEFNDLIVYVERLKRQAANNGSKSASDTHDEKEHELEHTGAGY